MSNLSKFSFSRWLASKQAVSFTLLVGIIFLITNYQGIIYRSNPDNQLLFSYPVALQIVLSHVDSFFFGFATAIIIFQSKYEWQKVMYCGFEGVMIFLNLNRSVISSQFNIDSQFLLASYVAVFSAFTLYLLGSLARTHVKQQSLLTEPEEKEEERAIQDALQYAQTSSKLNKHADIVERVKQGLSISQTVNDTGKSKSTVINIRNLMKELQMIPS